MIPTFVIYSPFRNVYSEISDIKSEISDIKSEMADFKKKLQEQMIWTSMDVDELRAECSSKGLVASSMTMTKSALIRLMLTTQQ